MTNAMRAAIAICNDRRGSKLAVVDHTIRIHLVRQSLCQQYASFEEFDEYMNAIAAWRQEFDSARMPNGWITHRGAKQIELEAFAKDADRWGCTYLNEWQLRMWYPDFF